MPSFPSHYLRSSLLACALTLPALPALGQTVTVYDSTGGAENGGASYTTVGHLLYDRFYNAQASSLASVTLNLALAKGGTGAFNVVLLSASKTGGPTGKATIIGTVENSQLNPGFQLLTLQPAAPITLKAKSYYWVGMSMIPHGKSFATWGNTLDPSVLARTSVAAGGDFYTFDKGIQPNSAGPFELQVNVTPTE